MREAQAGLCGCGCGRELGARVIAEHIWPVAMGNEGKPDALFRADCAAAKTRLDVAMIAKTKRMAMVHGQQARRSRAKSEGRHRPIPGRGFDRSLRKKMDGRVEKRDA